MGIDVTVTPNPKRKPTSEAQVLETSANLQRLEKKKWQGSSRSETLQQANEADKTKVVKRRINSAAGAEVTQELLDKNISVITAPIDGFLREADAYRWSKNGNNKKTFDASKYTFERAIGAKVGREMCELTMSDTSLCGVFKRANKNWKKHHGDRPFGLTHSECTPSDWANQYLACTNTWAFSHHILRCMMRAKGNLQSKKISAYLKADARYAGRFGGTTNGSHRSNAAPDQHNNKIANSALH